MIDHRRVDWDKNHADNLALNLECVKTECVTHMGESWLKTINGLRLANAIDDLKALKPIEERIAIESTGS
jgi:hypothetical protein